MDSEGVVMKIETKEQRVVWDALTALADSEIGNGVNAEGDFSHAVKDRQDAFVKGILRARLRAVLALTPPSHHNRHHGDQHQEPLQEGKV